MMNRLSGMLYPQEEAPADPFAMPAGGMLMAQAQRVPAGMQKQIIENDPDLYGPKQQAPATPQGQTFKGQVGTTVMPPEEEVKLRAALKIHAPNLTQAQYDAMVAKYKAQKGLR